MHPQNMSRDLMTRRLAAPSLPAALGDPRLPYRPPPPLGVDQTTQKILWPCPAFSVLFHEPTEFLRE